jgi:predicted hotdog family 3-hydroxylacyl-ACP dehydratase
MTPDLPIAALLPHAGAMVLLARIEAWDAQAIRCLATSHLDPRNPLRRHGRLSALAGIEYGLQAAAAHGALTMAAAAGQPGYLASLRSVTLHATWMDDPAIARLVVTARLEHQEAHGVVYDFTVGGEAGEALVAGRAVIALP